MRYLWVLVLAALAIAQQSGDDKKASKESDKKTEEPAPLFKNKLGYKSSQSTKESATLSFNGIDPSGKVDAKMMAASPTAASVDKAKKMAENRPADADLQAFLKEGGLNSK
jgi:hypothetical protein